MHAPAVPLVADIRIHVPHQLDVHLRRIGDKQLLIVYRSILVKLTSDMYTPVAEYLREHFHEPISEAVLPDKNMDGTEGCRTIYRIYERIICPRPTIRSCA